MIDENNLDINDLSTVLNSANSQAFSEEASLLKLITNNDLKGIEDHQQALENNYGVKSSKLKIK
jgi:hypothetical protein